MNKNLQINLEKGKLPPSAIDVEESVLGAMLIDRSGTDIAMEILKTEVFYKAFHKVIFEAISDLYQKNFAIDLLTVADYLTKTNKLDLAGGYIYIIGLTQKISSSAHIEFHSRILIQKFTQRKCIEISTELTKKAYDDDYDTLDLLEDAYNELGSVSDLCEVGKTSNFKENVINFFDNSNVSIQGIPSSLSKLNKKLNGYRNSDLIIIAGRPGSGKTAFTLNEIVECGLNNIPVLFFSLEMSEKQIISRMLSIVSGIENTKIKNNYLTNDERLYLTKYQKLLSEMPIYIDDKSGISPIEMKIKANKFKREKGIKIIFVDYLQLQKVKSKTILNSVQEVSIISGSLKSLAKDLNVPVVALSQLSRAVETRGTSKRPMLSDLRDSGSIEQDADIVMFIYRPEYYKIESWDDDEQSPTLDEAEIDISKFRDGTTGVTRVGCELKFMRFIDIENKGENIQYKYLKSENTNIELPKLQPVDAFGAPDDLPF